MFEIILGLCILLYLAISKRDKTEGGRTGWEWWGNSWANHAQGGRQGGGGGFGGGMPGREGGGVDPHVAAREQEEREQRGMAQNAGRRGGAGGEPVMPV
jgi:hypothetical protein